jgi:ABC-2 type transport system permease protein
MHAITPLHLRDTADASPPAMRQRLGRAVTQWSVTKAEWIKLRSVRVNIVGVAAAAVGLVLLGVLFSALAPTDMGPGGTATDSVSLAFGGTSLSQLIIGVLAALFVGSEYASGLIRTTFGAVARRTRVLRAKAIVFGGATGLAMALGAFAAFFAGSAVYSGNLPSHSIGDPGVLRAVLSVGFYGACVALIGIAVGFLVRSTPTAIGLLLGLLMLAPLLVDLVPGTVGETLSKIVPSNAGEAMMSVTSPGSLLSPMLGLAVLVAWVVGLLTLAAVALRRRDA